MKSIFIYLIISIVFVFLIGFNSTFLDFKNLLYGQSFVALMSIIATLCALVLLWILYLVRKMR